MRRAPAALLALAVAGCTTTLESGERRYREGDRVGALEVWRTAPESDPAYPVIAERIAALEEEFAQLVEHYKKEARHFEDEGRLAESIVNYRLALKLQPDDTATLDHVQRLARDLVERKAELKTAYRESLRKKNLATASHGLERLRALDPFDPELDTDELDDALSAEIELRLRRGKRGFSTRNYRSAERYFDAVLDLDPDDERARSYLSYIATIRRESQATEGGPVPFDTSPFDTEAEIRAEGFYQNGLASERTGDTDDLYTAIRFYLRALQAHSHHAAARRHLVGLRRQLANEVDPLIEEGRKLFLDEDLQSALDRWQEALLIDPDNERAHAYIARARDEKQNLERLRSEADVAGGRE